MKSKLLMLLIALLSLSAAHAQDFEYGGLKFTVLDPYDETVACTGYTSIPSSGAVVIPEVVNDYTVVAIGDRAFYTAKSLTSVSFPKTITSIGSWAFAGCGTLTSLTLPNSLTSIGTDAFNGCKGLTSLTLPNSLTTIGEEAFCRCTGLTSVKFPETLT